jgi:hypothetical protein
MTDDNNPKVFLEDYLKRKPLTPELEALARGDYPRPNGSENSPTAPTIGQYSFEGQPGITDDDREDLRRLTFEPGYRVLFRLIDKYVQAKETIARRASETDPLGNRDQIANLWAYVGVSKRFRKDVLTMVQDELRTLLEASSTLEAE